MDSSDTLAEIQAIAHGHLAKKGDTSYFKEIERTANYESHTFDHEGSPGVCTWAHYDHVSFEKFKQFLDNYALYAQEMFDNSPEKGKVMITPMAPNKDGRPMVHSRMDP